MALFAYMQQTQRLIGDIKQEKVAPNDIITYINIGRRQVAELTQSVRSLTPVCGSITSITVTNGGTGYTSTPTLTITPPDAPPGGALNPLGVQATATATVAGGIITSVTVVNAGSGYFQPTLTVTDATGSAAELTPVISDITETQEGQEIYSFADMPLTTPGAGSIFAIKSLSVIYANQRFSLPCYSFSTYQAYIRQFPYQYTYVPTIMSQYGQGVNGSLYMYPIANSNYQFEADCFCLPVDLTDDATIEAIPLPWTDAVPYYAAYLAFLGMQRGNEARNMLALFDAMLLRQSGSARSGKASNIYGRF